MFLRFMCSLSSKMRALASSNSAMFSHHSLPALYNSGLYKNSSHHRGARLVVRANSVSLLCDSFARHCVCVYSVILCDSQIY